MSVSIFDELLRDEEDPPPRPRRGSGARRVLKALLVTGAVTAVVLAGLRAIGVAVSVFAVVAGVVTLLVVRRSAARVAPPPPPPGAAVPGGDPSWASRDGLHRAIGRWERLLEWPGTDADRYNSRVLRRLGALADERMRQRHGFTRESDPARARALLGDALWTTLATDVRRPPSPRHLAAIVAELEKI